MSEGSEKPKKYFFEELLNFICDEKNEFYKDCYDNEEFNYLRASEKLYQEFSNIVELKPGIKKIDPISLISFIASDSKRCNTVKENYFKNENIEITGKKDFTNIGLFINYYNDDNEKTNGIITNLWSFAKELNGVVNTDFNYEETPEFKTAFRNIIPDEKIKKEGIKNIKASNMSCIMALCKPNRYKAINKQLLEDNKSNNKFNEIIKYKTIDELNNNCGYEMFNSIQSYLRKKSLNEGSENQSMSTEPQTQPLNQILYGPPGTGKTYNTVVKAMQIMLTSLYEQIKVKIESESLDENTLNEILSRLNIVDDVTIKGFNEILKKEVDKNEKLQSLPEKLCIKGENTSVSLKNIIDNENGIDNIDSKQYKILKTKFDELKKKGRIEFITFHQSYGYEDFIEGIKPNLGDESDDEVEYDIFDGIFKRISKDALNDRLEIKNDNQDKIQNFKYKKDKFIKSFNDGFELEINKSIFIIVKNTDKSLLIKPKNNNYRYSITYKYLEEAFIRDYKEREELEKINGLSKGLSYYYYDIYQKLINISDEKNTMENNTQPNNMNYDNLDLIEKYYAGDEGVTLKKLEESKPYVLIIDEINRGNISKILGELITLLEDDKRENFSVKLPYSHEEFTVPRNLYIIGTMNTADRSIALMDTALRRRFEFVEMMPNPDLLKNIKYGTTIIKDEDTGKEKEIDKVIDLGKMLGTMNARIEALYDREHTIGHAFFMSLNENSKVEDLGKIFKNKIIPLLQEYFYDDYSKIQLVLGDNQVNDKEGKNDNENNKNKKFIILKEFSSNSLFGEEKRRIPNCYSINEKAFDNPEAYTKIYR